MSSYELETYTWESLPVEMHLVRATVAHFHEVSARSRLIVSSRDRSIPLPPTEGVILHMPSKDDIGPNEEPRGSTIPVEILFPKAKRTRGRKGGEVKPYGLLLLKKFAQSLMRLEIPTTM